MSTWSLLRWIALVAGAELAVRGNLANHGWACHGGAALAALALAALAWPTPVQGPAFARRLGLLAAGVLGGLVAIDAALAAWAVADRPSPAPARELAAPAALPAAPAAPPAGSIVILAFGGSAIAGVSAEEPDWPARLQAALRERSRCERSVAVVDARRSGAPLGDAAALATALAEHRPFLVLVLAGPGLLDGVLEEAPALRFPAPEPIGARASLLGRALEAALAKWRTDRRWRRAVAADVALDPRSSPVIARYRELVLTARRAGAEIALLIPALAVAAESSDELRSIEIAQPHTRSWILASRAHARSIRAIAGSYGIRAIDTRPGLIDAVATALAEPLARTAPGCAAAR
jgi:hypothetical protein